MLTRGGEFGAREQEAGFVPSDGDSGGVWGTHSGWAASFLMPMGTLGSLLSLALH